MTNVLLIASLALPPSVNEYYRTDADTGRRVKTAKARTWEEAFLECLDYARAPKPYAVQYLNVEMVQEMRRVFSQTGKSKAVVEEIASWQFALDTLVVFKDQRPDIDNRHKPVQDMLFNWLADKRDKMPGIPSLTDRHVIETSNKRVVDKGETPHIEIYMRRCVTTWESGDLIALAMRQLETDTKFFAAPWEQKTDAIAVYDPTLQPTMAMPAITHDLQQTEPIPIDKQATARLRVLQPRLF